ncbi:DUF421 domain-containing protein [Bacillus taeanensis]|uniref:YetF C-terminal domain-containing protein n=1 Tax=Bacillus taeanensis TaxID=273032 RepID=A0A366XZ59_9BACI|nr:DUF421 domain-containing protein [Bacillus taeanensis]RBW70425.1 hypothetical protein DS031_05180 [Bacillus taeanensis]
MELATILLRTLFLYFFILLIYRLMGKREIGQLSVLDLVVSIMIAELAVVSIESPETPLIKTVLPIIILFVIQIMMAYFSLKSKSIRELIDGTPSVLINRGKIDEKEMKKQRYNFDDLLVQLREKDISKLSDVEFAILEPSGKMSVIKKNISQGSSNKSSSSLMMLPLILDGKVQEEHLKQLDKTPLWLRQELRKLGYRDIKKISYCSLDQNNTFFIDLKDDY